MTRALTLLAVVCTTLACREKSQPQPQPPPATPVLALTEQDTEASDGGLAGDGWRLTLDDRFLVVKEATRAKGKPAVQAWAVDPDGPVQLTVECKAAQEPAEQSLKAELDATKATQKLDEVSLSALEGPWLDGAVAQWTAQEGLHVQGRFRVLAGRCDVHAWGPKQGGPALAKRLQTAVRGFGASTPALHAELVSLTQWLKAEPKAQEKLTRAKEGGYLELSGYVLMENALARLPPERLAERFAMRVQVLDALSVDECGALVRRRLDVSPRLLERVPEPVAIRWVQLTREALSLALAADKPVVLPTVEEVAAAIEAMENDALTAAAFKLLISGDTPTNEELCAAEKVRITKILAQPPERRLTLLRSLVGERKK